MVDNARVSAFVAGLEPALAGGDHTELGPAIDHVIDRARAEWPAIAVDEDAFLAFVAHRVSGSIESALQQLPVADLYLACACSRSDPAALRAFEELLGGVDPALAQVGLFADLYDEVKQRLRIKLFMTSHDHAPRILDYLGRGSLRGWLRVVAVREALNAMRSDRRALADSLSGVPLAVADPELEHLKARYRVEFQRAISEGAKQLEPRERNLLRQYYLDGFTYDALARMYRVHLATVARWIEKARTALLASTRRVLITEMNVPRDELDSILRLIESQLEVSARDLIGEL
jgi:RNA polymerase sigma-70 factor, ECF subfamily